MASRFPRPKDCYIWPSSWTCSRARSLGGPCNPSKTAVCFPKPFRWRWSNGRPQQPSSCTPTEVGDTIHRPRVSNLLAHPWDGQQYERCQELLYQCGGGKFLWAIETGTSPPATLLYSGEARTEILTIYRAVL